MEDIGEVQEHLMNGDNEDLSAIEQKIMKLLQKVMNGMTLQRETAFRQLIDSTLEFGAGPLFNRMLALLQEHTLKDRQRYRLVKVIHAVLYKLNNSVQPYVHNILVVIVPLLNNDNCYVRLEGRDIISFLSKVAELDSIIAALSPSINDIDENVRSSAAKAFSIVAYAIGIPALLPFLKIVCKCQESWQTRHTGIKIVHQIAILFGSSVSPDDLGTLVEIIESGLVDDNDKVMTIAALSLAALAKATSPSGIEHFNSVLKLLWEGITQHSGKVLASFLKSIGFIVPMMEALNANDYTNKLMPILIQELKSHDTNMEKTVLTVIKQCVGTKGVEFAPELLQNFWDMGMTLDKRNHKEYLETIIEIEMTHKVGFDKFAKIIIENLTNDSEPRRQLAMEAIEKVVSYLVLSDMEVEVLIHGILYALREQPVDSDDVMVLKGFETAVTSLGLRVKSHFPQICDTLSEMLCSKSVKVRKQSADLISRIAVVMKQCEMDQKLCDFCTLIFDRLEQEYEEDLDSFLEALNSIFNAIEVENTFLVMNDLVTRLNILLDIESYKVQEICINLLNRIVSDMKESVTKENWLMASFSIFEKFVEPNNVIRTAAVNTFGAILNAKAVNPFRIIPTLIHNLVAADRSLRIWSTVALAIIAKVSSPNPVLYALIHKYCVPGMQCGVLQSLTFLFEYTGNLHREHMTSVIPLLEHALKDRDMVQRYLAVCAVKQMTLKAVGLGREDVLIHLLNHIWPNILENGSPLLINIAMEAIEAMRIALGSSVILNYCVQGMYHPARRVREIYWKIYNLVYIADPDALVAFYPSFSLKNKHEVRSELQMFI